VKNSYVFRFRIKTALVQPFDRLRANGGYLEIIKFFPFVVSLSNHQ